MLINGMELLYIQKTFIYNIYKGIYEIKDQQNDMSHKENIVLAPPLVTNNETEETEDQPDFYREQLQNSLQDDQYVENQIHLANTDESEKIPEISFMEKQDQEQSEVNYLNHDPQQVNQMSESIEEYKHEIKEQQDDISTKENVILASPSFTNNETEDTEDQPDFYREQLQDSLHDDQNVENQIHLANTNKSEKIPKVFVRENQEQGKPEVNHFNHHPQQINQMSTPKEEYCYEYIEWRGGIKVKKKLSWITR